MKTAILSVFMMLVMSAAHASTTKTKYRCENVYSKKPITLLVVKNNTSEIESYFIDGMRAGCVDFACSRIQAENDDMQSVDFESCK